MKLMKSLLVGGLLLMASIASAGTITFTSANVTKPSPYGQVTYSLLDATHAQFQFQAFLTGGNQYLFGGQGAVALNVNGPVTMGGVVAVNTLPGGFTPGPVTQAAPGNEDGFGLFSFTGDSFDGFQHSSTFISFTLTRTSGTWANEAAILSLNETGALAAAHIFACNAPCTFDSSASVTGYAAGNLSGGVINPTIGGDGTVPEPGTWALLGTGLVAAILKLRRRS